MNDVLIHQFVLGKWDNFIYFIGDNKTKEVFVVDPGWYADKIIDEANKLSLKIKGALCTHSHADHVNAVEGLLKTHDIPVYVLDKEVEFSNWKCENQKLIRAGDNIKISGIDITAVHLSLIHI